MTEDRLGPTVVGFRSEMLSLVQGLKHDEKKLFTRFALVRAVMLSSFRSVGILSLGEIFGELEQ